jgi:hypothetical protein
MSLIRKGHGAARRIRCELPPILTVESGGRVGFRNTWSHFLNELEPGAPIGRLQNCAPAIPAGDRIRSSAPLRSGTLNPAMSSKFAPSARTLPQGCGVQQPGRIGHRAAASGFCAGTDQIRRSRQYPFDAVSRYVGCRAARRLFLPLSPGVNGLGAARPAWRQPRSARVGGRLDTVPTHWIPKVCSPESCGGRLLSFSCAFIRHSRESGNPGRQPPGFLDPRFHGGDDVSGGGDDNIGGGNG